MSDLVLLIDTSLGRCLVALANQKGVIDQKVSDTTKSQSENLIPYIEALLVKNKLSMAEIHGIGVITGPGSYTALRIALAAVKGFYLANRCEVKMLSGFDALAEQASPHTDKSFIVTIDSRRGDYFCQKYDVNHRLIGYPFSADQNQLVKILENDKECVLIGHAVPPLYEIQNVDVSQLLEKRIFFPEAGDMAKLYFDSVASINAIADLKPFYMRPTEFVKIGS